MHFKLFLKLEHKVEEVRRFSCGVNTEYGAFRGLVREAFGHLPGDDFVLKWEDKDGDKVAISSDEEFKFALAQLKMSGEVNRVDVEIFENPWWKQVIITFLETSMNNHILTGPLSSSLFPSLQVLCRFRDVLKEPGQTAQVKNIQEFLATAASSK